jgi:hypothetical protein
MADAELKLPKTITDGDILRVNTRQITNPDTGHLDTVLEQVNVPVKLDGTEVNAAVESKLEDIKTLLSGGQGGGATEVTLASILANFNITLTQLRDAIIGGRPSSTLQDLNDSLAGLLLELQNKLNSGDIVSIDATSLPLPTGASTEATLADIKTTLGLVKDKTDNLDVLLSSRTKSIDVQSVSGSVSVVNQLVPEIYDAVVPSYTGDNITSLQYKVGGVSGSIVATVYISYDINGNFTGMWR